MSSTVAPELPAAASSLVSSGEDTVCLLPDAFFFFRRIELPPGTVGEERDALIELTLEECSPFPLPQMAYGYYAPEGAARVLAFAAYRKKVETKAGKALEESDFVLPALVAALDSGTTAERTVLVETGDSLTLLVFAAGDPVPVHVVARYRGEDRRNPAGPEEIEALYRAVSLPRGDRPENLCRHPAWAGWETKQAVWIWNGPAGEDARPVKSAFTRRTLERLDIREKGFLAERRQQRRTAARLRRGFYSLVVLLLFLFIGELALGGGQVLLSRFQNEVAERAQRVQRIQEEDVFANRMQEISENRLVPFVMLEFVNRLRPRSITFSRAEATGNMTLDIVASTPNNADLLRFADALEEAEAIERAEVSNQSVRDGQTTFRMTIRFRSTPLLAFADELVPGRLEVARGGEEESDDPTLPEVLLRETPSPRR